MGKQKKVSRKERAENFISKFAFTILFALCIQFIVYLLILNFVPTFVNDANGNVIINPLYFIEKDHYGSSQYDNGTRIIYYYNMILLVATLCLILYYFVNFMENNDGKMLQKIKKFLKEQWPFTLLLIFMGWVFISSLLAKDYYRSFIGCFNLKDGYLSFMMYGSMLVCTLLLGKNKEKYSKILVNTFLITATIVALLSLGNYYYVNSDAHDGSSLINSSAVTIGELLFGNAGYPLGENFLIVTRRIIGEPRSGIFHNSNHYGYYLSICVIVAAVMFIKQSLRDENDRYNGKNIIKKLLYLASYIVMLKMTIINNTLGTYLGIAASLIFMLIYALIPKTREQYMKEFIATGIIIAIFALLSATTVNTKGENNVYNNFSGLARDIKTLINTTVNNKDENISVEEINPSNQVEVKEENSVDNIGSGRGRLWGPAWKMALQKPFFGYGLENIKYEYDAQFDINEGRSHNLVLQLAATTGIVGMLLYVAGIASIWIRKLKYIKEWDVYECLGMFVIVSYIVSSIVGNSAFYTSGYFYIFVGFVALSIKNDKQIINSKNKKV